ncbi:MAG: LCP family protein [Clostridia bacterium]|nr:LCP family protein [Clostridia bacterium]
MKKTKKIFTIILCVVLAMILALVGTFFTVSLIGKSQFHKDDTHISTDAVDIEDDDTITYNGKKYKLNKNIVSILVMGIDRDNVNQNLGSGKNGQADVIFVATIDTKTKKACIIPISRETMTEVNLYTSDGKFAGTKKEQICLAYAYGNSTEESSKNVLTSVKRILYGININSYVTMEMKGVEKLTDLVGGVEVTSLENIPSTKLTVNKGQKVKLNGSQARIYIQYRGDDTEANARRMQRQKQFLSALMNKTGNAILKDFSNLAKFYNAMSPYFSSNVSFAQITYISQNCLSSNFGDSLEYKSIEGTLTQGENWVEFYADEESTLQTVIDVFYVPVD